MNIFMHFCLDLEELKNCKTELSIIDHIEVFDVAYFFDVFKQLLKDYIKTIGTLVFSELYSKDENYIDFLNKNFQDIKVSP